MQGMEAAKKLNFIMKSKRYQKDEKRTTKLVAVAN
jgi:hypothetical protein